ncbi:MAG: hypothetical protein ABI858_11775, partial [Pseudoxanthomonas sp.]
MTPKLCSLVLVVLLGTTTASLPVHAAPESTLQEKVSRCFKLRGSEPAAAVGIAESLLATPGLPVEEEIKSLCCLGIVVGMLGDQTRAAETANLIKARLEQNRQLPPEFRLRALSNAGAIFHTAGQLHHAEAAYLQVNELAKHATVHDAGVTRTVTLTNIGAIHADYLDSPEVAEDYYRQAQAAAQAVGQPNQELSYNRAINLVTLGRRPEALLALQQVESGGNAMFAERARSEQAGLLIDEGKLQRARTLLQKSLTWQRALPDPAGEAVTLVLLARLQRLSGEKSAA